MCLCNLLIKTLLTRLANKVLNLFSLENHIESLTSMSSLPASRDVNETLHDETETPMPRDETETIKKHVRDRDVQIKIRIYL